MVRLVFRPYTQVYRSICTSEPIRTSTRVSSGFILLRHSSPSFGSQPVRSTSAHLQADKTGPWCAARKNGSHVNRLTGLYFHFAVGFITLWLAHKLHSSVRVSRRVGKVVDFHTGTLQAELNANRDWPKRKQDTTEVGNTTRFSQHNQRHRRNHGQRP